MRALFGLITANGGVVFFLAAFVAVTSTVGAIYLVGRDDGADAVTEQVDRRNRQVIDGVREPHSNVDLCHDQGRFWDAHEGICR